MSGRATAIAIALAVALVARPETSLDSGAAKRLLLAVVAVAVSIHALRSERPASLPTGGGPLLAFVAWSLLTVGLSPHASAIPVAVLLVTVVAIAFGVRTLGLGAARRIAIGAASLLGTAVALHVLVTFARGGRGLSLEGAQGNPNWAGMVLAMAIPLGIEALRRATSRILGLLTVAALGAMAVALGMTHARVAWVALGVGAAVMAATAPRSRRALAGVFAMALAGALLTQGNALPKGPKAFAAGPTTDAYEAPAHLALSGRVAIARIGVSAAIAHAPLGVGLGGFSGAYLAAQGDRLSRLTAAQAARTFIAAQSAHDDFVETAVETGPLGLALLVLSLARALFAQRNPGLRSALLVFCVCALGDAPLRLPATVALLALVVAATPGPRARGVGAPERLVVLAAAALALACGLRARVADRLVARAEVEIGQERALLSRALRADPWSTEAALRLGLLRLDDGDPPAALALLQRARAYESSVAVELALAAAFDAVADPVGAEQAARRALLLHPGSFRGWIALAHILRSRGALDEAQRALDTARTILPHHPAIERVRTDLAEARIEAAG